MQDGVWLSLARAPGLGPGGRRFESCHPDWEDVYKRQGESPVHERRADMAVSRVPRDTRNLVGTRGDHPVSLNTP